MTVTTKDEAIAALTAGALQVQEAVNWLEENEPSPALTRLHTRIGIVATDAETFMGVSGGTFANPLDGTGKPAT